MTKLGKIGITVGNKTGGSPAATVSQLKSYLKELQDGFNDLKRAAEPAANQVSRLSDSMQHINEATTNIVKFSEELSKKLKDIRGKGKVSKLNADSTVFSSFSDLVDLVTSSVSPTKIAKFESISKSLRSFTLSLNDMISISKSFTKINKFVNDLNTPATEGGKDSPFAKLVTVIGSYVNVFGELGGRSQEISKGKDGVEKTKNIINPTIQGIKDIFSTIKDLTQDLSGLISNDTQAGLNILTSIKDRLIAFFTRLGDFAIVGTDTKSSGKIVPILNQKIQGFNLLVDSLKQLSSVLSKLSSINEARDKLISTRDAIIDFIKGFFIQEETLPMVVGDKSNLSVYKPVLDNLQNGINNLSSITELLLKLAGALPKLSLVKESRDRLKETQQAIIDFVKGFYTCGSGEEGLVVYTGNQNYAPFLDSLKNGYIVMKAITDVFSKLSFSMPKLTLVQKAREDFIATRKAITDFVKGFFFEGDATLDADQSNKFKIYLISLKNGLTIMSAITDVITKLANSVPKLAMVEEARNNLKATRQAILDFVKGFFFEGDISAPLDTSNTEKYKTFLASIQNGLQFMNAILKPLSKYASVLGSLKKIGSINTVDWKSTKGALFDFIKGFIPDDAMSAEQLGKGLSVLDAVSKVVRKYTNVVNALSNIGSVNTIDWESTKKSLVLFLESFVNDPALESLAKDAVKRFSTLSNSLRGIATFINSIGKNKIGEGLTKIEGAKDKIKQFIESMAELKNNDAFPDFERVAKAVGSFNGRLHDATKTVERSNQSFTKLKSILRQIYTAFVGGAVIYSIVRSIKSAVKEVYNLEYAMARVNTIARVSSNELKNMTHFVQEVSASYGIASEKVSKALYDINSATIKGVSSLKILEQSAKLAVAGFTDIDKVTNLIARAVNAYEYSVSEAAKISDILFVTVERGINPMEELSEYMGRLFTVSANAGVSLEEVGAGLATLTARGYQTNVASTALNSAILKLSTGTKELNKLFQQYGYASSASALRTVGLTGALQVLYKATNGATEKLHDLGFNYRDIRAATTLASGAIDEYNKTLALMNDETYKAGLTNKAYSEVQDTLIFKINRLKETYTVLIQSVSEYMNKNKMIKGFIDLLTDGISSLTKSLQGFNITLQEQLNIGLVTFIPKVVLAYGVLKAVPKILLAIKTGFIGVNGVTKAWSLSLKGLGSAFTTSLTVINALLSFFKDLSNIIESGTLASGLKAVFTTAEGALSALAGAAGRFIDFITFTTTNFGEKWSQYFLKPDYKPVGDESTAKGFTEQELLFRDKVSELNGSFIKKGLSEFDYRTENIEAEFNSIMNSIQNYADSLKLDEEFVNKNTEAVRTAYNDKIKETKAVNALTPNMKALSDVFEEVSKKLRENADKQEDSIAKLVSSSMKAQFGFDTIAKETGMSLRQIKNAFSSDANIADFKKIIEITPAMFAESAKMGMSLFKNLPQEERLSRVLDIIERNDKIPEYAIPKFEALRNSATTFNDLANVTDFNKIANYVADALQLSPEVRKAMSELGEGTSGAVKNTLELSKTLTKLGYDVTKIKPQLSASEIVGNVFGLSEITTLKESLRNKLVKPSELESFDDAIIDSILSNVMEAIGANKSVEEINAMIQEAFPDLSSEQLEDIGGSIYSIASRLIKISSDFVKQFSELDFSKTMNRLKFGSELSGFKQYQQVGKEMLKNLYDRTIEGIDFRTLLNEFDRNKEQFGFNQARLMFIEKFGKTGEIAWTAFVDAFKDLGDLAQQFINPLNTEFRNLKKRGKDFVKNYRDSLLSPIEQFQKTEALLNRRLANIREQSKNGRLNPESIKNAMDTIDKLYKLNEETMNLKVPASITASEFVRSGSKEAFDLVARNVFKDTYKVNVRQENLQKTLVNDMKTLVKLATQGSKNVSESVTYP